MRHFSVRLGLAFLLLLTSVSAFPQATIPCAICHMNFKPAAKTAYETQHGGKPVHFCSFTCAHRFHKKYPSEPLWAFDYKTASRLDATSAFFLVRSKNLLNLKDAEGKKVLDFDMPPSVVAFEGEKEAQSLKTSLKDGEVVHGFAAAEKVYE